MATIKSEELAQIEANADLLEGKKVGAKIRRYANTFEVDEDAAGTVLECQALPLDGDLLAIIVKPDGSLGTAKLEIGTAEDSDAYAEAATYTASAIIVPLDHHCDGVNPILTTSVAALPAETTIHVEFLVAETR